MEEELIAALTTLHLSIGTCESFTGGMFCARLTAIPHASAVVKGGIITYATQLKERLVGVDKEIIERYGVISKECAEEMAIKARALLQCDICVSFTGNAGPGCMEDKPAGCVYCAIAERNLVTTYALQYDGGRLEVRSKAMDRMMEEILNRLLMEQKG